ncbi:MAG: nickel-responsive transcriptional regulator NikR [Rhodospirillaceae bacterium]
MERISISLDEDLLAAFDRLSEDQGYTNRSEAFRDLLRDRLERDHLAREEHGTCIAALTYVYDHQKRQLAARLVKDHHHRHDLSLSTLHVHIDHDNCLETVILRGPVSEVRAFADRVLAQPGVRHGDLHLIPVTTGHVPHHHGAHSHAPAHSHGSETGDTGDQGHDHDHRHGPGHEHYSPVS